MKRALFLPCLLLGFVLVAPAGTARAQSDFYLDVRVGSGQYSRYPQQRYRRDYRPYQQLQQWRMYLSQQFRSYDRWWRYQSSYYQQRTRMTHDYGVRLHDEMFRYASSGTIQQMEEFLRRHYYPYANSYSNPGYRDPWYGGGYRGDDYYRYPNNRYYEDTARRQYYGNDRYYYDRYDRERDYHAYGTGHGIGDIVRGSRTGDDLGVWSGALQTAGNILGLVQNEREQDRREDFGRYYRYR